MALAFIGALEGTVIGLAGQASHDELLAARAAAGVLGLRHLPDEVDLRGAAIGAVWLRRQVCRTMNPY